MGKVKEETYRKHYRGYRPVTLSDLPEDMKRDDQIEIRHVEPFYSENNSWDERTELVIYRLRDETQEEKDELKSHFAQMSVDAKECRRINYLTLREEFRDE